MNFMSGIGTVLRDIPLWAHLLFGSCLLFAGVILVLFVRPRRNPSFLRDFILLLGLTLPIVGGSIFLQFLLPSGSPGHDRGRLIILLAIGALAIYAASRLSVTAIRWWATRSEPIRSSQRTLVRIVRLAILALGLLVLLEVLRIPITPLLTTLGIGSFAIALALQDTLSNLFAGLYIAADQPLREGDYIKLNTGEEGVVLGVGWRSTQLRNPANNVVIVSNAKLAQASITNFDLGDRRVAISIRVPVACRQDPRRVISSLEAAVRGAAGQVTGLMDLPAPAVRFDPGFGDLALEFTITCNISSRENETLIKSELRQRAAEQLSKDGIELYRPDEP